MGIDYRYNPVIMQLHTSGFTLAPKFSSEVGTLSLSVVNEVTGERRMLKCGSDWQSVASLRWTTWPTPIETEDEDSDFYTW
ncbi:MAG: hypothetical protein QUS07_02530 [Methanothrix sp.]|nr:hypothetical protein [Methanothrix sp.]